MRSLVLIMGLLPTFSWAQSTTYSQQINKHRQAYREEFLSSKNSPIRTPEALTYLRFYAPDSTYRVVATVLRTPDAKPIAMPTYSGKTSDQVAYAQLSFMVKGQSQTLIVYRSLGLANNPIYRDYLFLPFKDATTGKETYGGGRYLDLRSGDIRDGKLILDFNKAYNPYCAYGDGYSCPIPPVSNTLRIAIQAGERTYGKAH